MSNELLDPRLPPLVRIVDDDDRVRQSEAFVLRLEGFDVREYSSAEDFLHFDDVSRAGCIVLDIRMPGMNGLELQSELLRTGRSLPILFLTGHGDVAMAVDALKRGAADFIQKPVKAERLAALTHELVAWHQQYTQRLTQRRHAIEKLKALTPKELEVCRLAASGLSNKAIAKELGILQDGSLAVTGAELEKMDDAEFAEKFRNISVYARVQPEHKTRIVNAWRNAGYVTAMTGDGVNDAPSIKAADIGIGMGITGTDVTKNVADMVLADDNFATIVGAVEEGRRIYDNIRKAIQFLLGSNMSEVLSIFFATLLGFTILQPVHLLWINLVTDCFPALALGTEKAEPNIMKRKPRDAKAGIFADGMGFDIAYQGLLVTALVMVSYFIGHFMETGEWTITNSAHGTTMAFVTMSMAEIFHSMNMRSQRGSIFKLGSKNWLLLGAAVVSLLATTAVCEIPLLAGAFGFTSVEPAEYLVALLLSVLVVPIVELVKWIQRRSAKHED